MMGVGSYLENSPATSEARVHNYGFLRESRVCLCVGVGGWKGGGICRFVSADTKHCSRLRDEIHAQGDARE